ncbi:hypothetical protein HAX54_027827, partial [Datura stramonium]|nr:hypothetical protein [Datura stramonium]
MEVLDHLSWKIETLSQVELDLAIEVAAVHAEEATVHYFSGKTEILSEIELDLAMEEEEMRAEEAVT